MLYSEVATPSGPGQGSTLEQWAVYYGYDADGNRLETDGGDFLNGQGDEEEASFWEYNANSELHQNQQYNPDQDNPSITTTTYTYDANGNEVEADSTTEHQQQEDGDGNDSFQSYTYDVRGEMVKYVDGNGTTTTYTYDDAGNRVKEVGPINGHSTTTTYLIDGNNPTRYAQAIEEHVNGAATPSITYFVGLDGTQGQTAGSTVIYMLRDAKGYARVLTNAAGSVTQYDDYDAYGNQTTGNNIPTTHYFPDGVLDPASGLTFHFGGRQSSTVNGDFIQQDPHRYVINMDPTTANRYVLDGANPINMIDPSGHLGIGDVLTVTAIAGLLLTLGGVGIGYYGATHHNPTAVTVGKVLAEGGIFTLGAVGAFAAFPEDLPLVLKLLFSSVAGGGFDVLFDKLYDNAEESLEQLAYVTGFKEALPLLFLSYRGKVPSAGRIVLTTPSDLWWQIGAVDLSTQTFRNAHKVLAQGDTVYDYVISPATGNTVLTVGRVYDSSGKLVNEGTFYLKGTAYNGIEFSDQPPVNIPEVDVTPE